MTIVGHEKNAWLFFVLLELRISLSLMLRINELCVLGNLVTSIESHPSFSTL